MLRSPPKSSIIRKSYPSKLAIKSACPLKTSRQAVQDNGKVHHQHRYIPVKQGVGDTTDEKGLADSHIPKQQQAGVVPVCLLPVLHIGACLAHQEILAVVISKGVVRSCAVPPPPTGTGRYSEA